MEKLQVIVGNAWILIVMVILLLMLSSCASVEYKEYHDNGEVKVEYKREGFVNWSDGEGKVMPFGQISVNGVGIK